MPLASQLMVLALALNVIILVPVITALVRGGAAAAVFGDATPARAILTSIYAAIALVSLGLIALHVAAAPWAVPMTVALFAVQIVYKALTVPAVGLRNPVVVVNLVVVLVQAGVLAVLWAG